MTSSRHKTFPSAPDATRPSSSDEAYLDAARLVILTVGWSRATLTDIARRAGVSRMTLYRRWPDTQTLLADLMTREWGEVVAAADPGSDVEPLRRITAAVVATVRGLRENELLRRIVDVAKGLWDWRYQVETGGPDAARTDCTLDLLDYDGSSIATYNIKAAWPSKYTGVAMNANSNEIAVEAITICHEGFKRM